MEEENKEENKLEENNKEVKKGIKTKENKQIAIAIVLMVLVVFITIIVPMLIQHYANNFKYINLDFAKEKYGDVIFYNTKIPLVNNSMVVSGAYSLDFRTDPRTLGDIKINISDNELKVLRNVKTYLTIAPDVKPCEDNVIASVGLARFLNGFAQLNVVGASSDKNYSTEFNTTYANCNMYPDNTVILLQSGNETKIEKTSKNCYELTYKDCEILRVTEAFDLLILKTYMDNFERV